MGGLVVCRGAIGSLLLLRFCAGRTASISSRARAIGLGLGPTPANSPQRLMGCKPFGMTWLRNLGFNSPGLSDMLL